MAISIYDNNDNRSIKLPRNPSVNDHFFNRNIDLIFDSLCTSIIEFSYDLNKICLFY